MFQMVCVNLIVLHEQNRNSKTDLLSKKKKNQFQLAVHVTVGDTAV